MAKETTMFLNNITCLDHAFIDDNGMVNGGSYHVSCDVTGRVDELEQVVEFSNIKKRMKAAIDDMYDHRLWLHPGWSKYNIKPGLTTETRYVETPILTLNLQDDAIIECRRDISNELSKYLTVEMDLLFPSTKINVKVYLTEDFHFRAPQATQYGVLRAFRYVHGLKNSTSYGCQNIAHGHLSFIEILHNPEEFDSTSEQLLAASLLTTNIEQFWDGKVYVHNENILQKYGQDNILTIGYSSPRGNWIMEIPGRFVRVFEKETTIENLLDAFCNDPDNAKAIKTSCVSSIYLSEGLSKGAVRHF